THNENIIFPTIVFPQGVFNETESAKKHRHTFALAPLVEWNGSGSKTLNRAYGVRSEWNLDKGSWTWSTEAEWKHLSHADKTRLLDGSLLSVYNTLSYFPRNDLMFYGGIDW
ncbi:surface lipoprotein assembly modifier, partial [Neisseria meningitidis]|nr:surface lipoprotein assembly modifier [Neisseria meningitidis]